MTGSVDVSSFIERRARLAARMEPGAVAVLATALEVLRNGDSEYPYRHDSSFYYLTGFAEPESVLVLVAARGDAPARSILFCREKNVEREIWDGFRHGPEAARVAFGFDEAYPVGELDAQMATVLADAPAIWYALGHSAALDAQVGGWLKAVRAKGRTGIAAPSTTHHLPAILDEMRLLKDAGEQALMARAAAIAAGAHARAMRFTRPGVFEYEIEAELLHEFRRHGAQFPAYTPIVASGANACVLHYNANNRRCLEGELVLVDAGCEFDGYASDITRTWPVNGRFSAPQRALYELVLAAQEAAFAAIVPGRPYSDVHTAAVRVLTAGMLDLGLIDKARYGSVEDAIADKAHLPFYMHGTGHWLGMDVHDVGPYRDLTLPDRPSRPLLAGMALTVEPGIYVRPAEGVPEEYWGIGIRIEDDVIVVDDGCRILSGDAPKRVAEVEQLMGIRA
ncbi:aminopeptidase P N-terminal domain-containing protein [Massilia sp. G4R7]|uniref:Xaa-Pro aminopeptidase n=1 Tax=Massilia phyllostachyos TaxID=2898585 RepID=A0ABS8PZ74_9BURK|nr:aminopeptidase P N-terminal domain-containing protein [Massilia phyllostachyos]MCD2514806.1 aminopeptidase P N-terminal domain-containing protein [Massilia phyllostachyos]